MVRHAQGHRDRGSCAHGLWRRGLSEPESALSALPRRAGGAVHATVLAERGVRVHRESDARSRPAPGVLKEGRGRTRVCSRLLTAYALLRLPAAADTWRSATQTEAERGHARG